MRVFFPFPPGERSDTAPSAFVFFAGRGWERRGGCAREVPKAAARDTNFALKLNLCFPKLL